MAASLTERVAPKKKEQKLHRIVRRRNAEDLLAKANLAHGEDNRDLPMASGAQQLTHDEIEHMKSSGKGVEEIIEALMSNSVTLESKTAFSQEKWWGAIRSYQLGCAVTDITHKQAQEKAGQVFHGVPGADAERDGFGEGAVL